MKVSSYENDTSCDFVWFSRLSEIREAIDAALKAKSVSPALFDGAQAETLEFLRVSCFPEFQRSSHYEKALFDVVRAHVEWCVRMCSILAVRHVRVAPSTFCLARVSPYARFDTKR